MKPLHKKAEVTFDLVTIYIWLGGRDLDAGERFLRAVELTLEQIQNHPQIGWSRPWRNRKLEGLRSWRVEGFRNFLVFYREEETTIEVYVVLRGARHLQRALLGRRR